MRWLPVNRAAVLLTLTAILRFSSHSGTTSSTRWILFVASPRDDHAESVCHRCIVHIVREISSCPAVLLLVSGVGTDSTSSMATQKLRCQRKLAIIPVSAVGSEMSNSLWMRSSCHTL
ncbi:hypothetical protein EVAR_41367_1 [Eumeta japonica]|uniref:Secreted protein n=1 Tax=Eumeta variegata TaxID=151549 RepID=A0A4C1XMF1_EUMVA|nr:hypothetical protein EVAR_41367_1 [Eumeta japonica]